MGIYGLPGAERGKTFAEKVHSQRCLYSGQPRTFKYLERQLKALVLVRCSHFIGRAYEDPACHHDESD
jgi:hypothetical protein